MNMRKVVWCRFQQCLGTFTILFVEASPEKKLFGHLSNHVFRVGNFKNTKAVKVIFFFKCSKVNLDFKIAAKNWQIFFCFSDDCISVGIVRLSLLRTGYFAANVLTISPKIWYVNKRDFFEHNYVASGQWRW